MLQRNAHESQTQAIMMNTVWFFMVIPFIRAQNKEDTCFERGDRSCLPDCPAQCNGAVITLRELSPWGEPGGEGETPMNVRVFKTFPMKMN